MARCIALLVMKLIIRYWDLEINISSMKIISSVASMDASDKELINLSKIFLSYFVYR